MSETDNRSTKQLFNDWRKGDGQAGGMMAQRFADWYYAITTSRLGEARGQDPCNVACQQFERGIASVTDAKQLVDWAHQLVLAELQKAGGRATDGDMPNAYTGDRSPKQLLQAARVALPREVSLLEASYGGRVAPDQVDALAEPLGGNPLGILRARYRVKQWLRDQQGIPFDVAPDSPVLDRAPLPLYESGRMASPQEEMNFEQWMISDIDLCRDIAEFAHFAIALRGGLPAEAPAPAPARPVPAPAPVSRAPAAAAAPEGAGMTEQELAELERRPGCLARLFGRG